MVFERLRRPANAYIATRTGPRGRRTPSLAGRVVAFPTPAPPPAGSHTVYGRVVERVPAPKTPYPQPARSRAFSPEPRPHASAPAFEQKQAPPRLRATHPVAIMCTAPWPAGYPRANASWGGCVATCSPLVPRGDGLVVAILGGSRLFATRSDETHEPCLLNARSGSTPGWDHAGDAL